MYVPMWSNLNIYHSFDLARREDDGKNIGFGRLDGPRKIDGGFESRHGKQGISLEQPSISKCNFD